MSFDAVLFDLDGTLLDTYEDIADSTNAVLAEIGQVTIPAELIKQYIGDGVEVLFQRALGSHDDPELPVRCAAMFRNEYSERWACKTRPFEGVAELIATLVRRGTRIGVISNKPDLFTHVCVARFLPAIPSDVVLGAQPEIPRKPDPTGALLVAERLQAHPTKILYLGDSATDMQTAVATGMYPVGATWGYRSVEELLANGATALLAKPLDLLNLLDDIEVKHDAHSPAELSRRGI